MIKRRKTFVEKLVNVKRQWHMVDLSGSVLGRSATTIAQFLNGRQKPSYTPHVDSGDYVIAINSDKVAVTGRKVSQKLYHWNTGYPTGLRTRSFGELQKEDSRRIIKSAVSGMLPKNKFRQHRINRLKIFVGADHPYQDKMKGSQ